MPRNVLTDSLNLEAWDRKKEIGLIAAPCGAGKTYASVMTIPALLNVEPQDTLLLSPRTVIKQQTLDQYSDYCEERGSGGGKVQIATCHALGKAYRHDGKVRKPRLVIVDEWHTLYCENNFASDLLYFQMLLQTWVDDPTVAVMALTATRTLPLEFVNKAPFEGLDYIYENKFPRLPIRCICNDLEPKYKAKQTYIEQGKSLETVLRSCPSRASRKQLVFVKGKIERLIKLASDDERATWLCSKSSTSKVEGVSASELMNQEHYESILAGRMPSGIDRIYLSSAYREGLNVTDENVREVIIEGTNDIEIVQSLGRVRHSIDRLIVVVDKRRSYGLDGKVKKALELLKDGTTQAFELYYQLQQAQEQDGFEGERVPVLVYKANNRFRFNYYALCYWLYSQWSVFCAEQSAQESREWFGSKLPKRNEYFKSIIGKYSDSRILFNQFSYIRPNTIEQENAERIESFDWDSWSGKELFGQAAKDFSSELGLKNKDGSSMALSGIFKKINDRFEGKSRLTRQGKRQVVYTLK